MFKDYITIEYVENQIQKISSIIDSQRLTGDDLENAETFFIEFIEFMKLNSISLSGCHFFASLLKESIEKQISLIDAKKLIKYAGIYLSIIKKSKKIPIK